MSATLRASATGLEQVDRARKKKGWNKTEPAWCDQALTTIPTLKRFWLGKAIQGAAFQGICQVVGIEDWEAIVDHHPTESTSAPLILSTYDQATWVGRAGLIQSLTEKLQKRRVLLLTGLTGIGKTALAERLATECLASPQLAMRDEERLLKRFCSLNFDEVQEQNFVIGGRQLLEDKLKVSLPKEDLNDATAILRRLAQTLKMQPYWLQLDSLEVLLVEDEQGGNRFADSTWLSFFRQLLSADCLSYCVLTSQDLPGDLKLLGSRYAKVWECQALQGLTAAEQVALFQRQGIEPNAENLGYLERISKAYEGHPLVLQVIAGEILSEFQGQVQLYWQRYQTELEQIEQLSVPLPTRSLIQLQGEPTIWSRELKHVVRNRVRQSLERLPTVARQLFCASSVYRRPVPIAFWLAMANHWSEAEQQAAFDTLQDRYLVEWEGNLIRAHNLTRSVAADWLKADRAAWQIAHRIAADCWRTADSPDDFRSQATVSKTGRLSNLEPKLERVRGLLEAFHHFCEVEDWQAATDILRARSEHLSAGNLGNLGTYELHRQLSLWGYYTELLQLYGQLLHRATPQTDLICLNGLGSAHTNLSQYDNAIVYLQQGLNLARELGNRQQEAIVLNGLSLVQFRLSNYTEMVELLQQSLPIAQALGDQEIVGQALGYLGCAAIAVDNQTQAIEYFQQALKIAQETGDRYGEEVALFRVGSAYANEDNQPQAIEYFQQALAIAEAIGDRAGEGLALRGLGNAYYFLSQYPEAMDYYQQHLALVQSLGNLQETGNALGNLGNIHSVLGNYLQAVEFYQQHLKIALELGVRLGEAQALGNLGNAYHHLGRFAEALDYLQRTLQLCREIGSRRGEAITTGNLGKVYTALGKLTQAIEFNQQSLKLSREVSDRQNEAVVLGNLGKAYAALGDFRQAIDQHQQQLALAREIGDRRTESRGLLELGKILMELGQQTEAADSLQAALALCQTIGDRLTQIEVLQHLARLSERNNLSEQAGQFEAQAEEIAAALRRASA